MVEEFEGYALHKRIRLVKVVRHSTDDFTIQFIYAEMGMDPREFVRKFKLREMFGVAAGRDKFYFNISRQNTLHLIAKWRKSCKKAGFSRV